MELHWALVAVTLALPPTADTAQQPLDVPSGIVYHPASAESLDAARGELQSAVKAGSASLRDRGLYSVSVISGPVLWAEIARDPSAKEVPSVPMTINIPIGQDKYQRVECRLFQGDSVSLLANRVAARCTSSPISIQSPSREDLSLYWVLIPYEIEGPVFVLLCGDTRLFVDLDENYKIFWIDDFTDAKKILGAE